MKRITAGRYSDELRARKLDFEARMKAERENEDAQWDRFSEAEEAVFDSIRKQVLKELDGLGLTDLEIRVYTRHRNIEVVVADETDRTGNKALHWTWSATLGEDGEVIKDSSSWSGLKAVTSDQIDYLEGVLEALKILNNMDWYTLLNQDLPQWKDYVTERDPELRQSNLDKLNDELKEAEIREAMEDNVAIRGHGYKYYRKTAKVCYIVSGESSKFWTVEEVMPDAGRDHWHRTEPYRIKKELFYSVIDYPLDTVPIPEGN